MLKFYIQFWSRCVQYWAIYSHDGIGIVFVGQSCRVMSNFLRERGVSFVETKAEIKRISQYYSWAHPKMKPFRDWLQLRSLKGFCNNALNTELQTSAATHWLTHWGRNKNGRHFIWGIFYTENAHILIRFSIFVSKGSIDNKWYGFR